MCGGLNALRHTIKYDLNVLIYKIAAATWYAKRSAKYIATAPGYSIEIKNTSPTRSMPCIAPYRRPLDCYPLPHLIMRTQQVCLRTFAQLSPYT